MKNRIHFLPAGQVDNLGDQLINMAVVDAVRPYGEVVINDLDGDLAGRTASGGAAKLAGSVSGSAADAGAASAPRLSAAKADALHARMCSPPEGFPPHSIKIDLTAP